MCLAAAVTAMVAGVVLPAWSPTELLSLVVIWPFAVAVCGGYTSISGSPNAVRPKTLLRAAALAALVAWSTVAISPALLPGTSREAARSVILVVVLAPVLSVVAPPQRPAAGPARGPPRGAGGRRRRSPPPAARGSPGDQVRTHRRPARRGLRARPGTARPHRPRGGLGAPDRLARHRGPARGGARPQRGRRGRGPGLRHQPLRAASLGLLAPGRRHGAARQLGAARRRAEPDRALCPGWSPAAPGAPGSHHRGDAPAEERSPTARRRPSSWPSSRRCSCTRVPDPS